MRSTRTAFIKSVHCDRSDNFAKIYSEFLDSGYESFYNQRGTVHLILIMTLYVFPNELEIKKAPCGNRGRLTIACYIKNLHLWFYLICSQTYRTNDKKHKFNI